MADSPIPLISVVVPAYNAERTLDTALAPLVGLLLDREIVELIVVDDGSTDATAWVAKEAGARVVPSGGRLGPAGARNVGAAAAKGNILWFVDADVVVHPDGAKILKEAFDRSKAAAVFGIYDEFPAATNFLSHYRNLAHRHHHVRAGRNAETFFAGCGAVRTAAFRVAGGFDAARYPQPSIEDIELGVRLRRRGLTIRLEPELQARHLKTWHFGDMLRADILQRACPYARLLADHRVPLALRLSWPERARLLVAWAFVLSMIALLAGVVPLWLPFALIALAIAVNPRLFVVFGHANGWWFAFRAMLFHQLHHVYSSAAFVACRLGWSPDKAPPEPGRKAAG
jgi:glycosyltransferase involved in cell wall biosynthesis